MTDHRFGRLLTGVTALAALVTPALPAAATGSRVSHTQLRGSQTGNGEESVFYLALGDSQSVGFQPDRGLSKQGYVDDLWRSEAQRIKGLKLRKMGCIGETTRSLVTGKNSMCHYAAGSQFDAALTFLNAHPGQVAFITITIGANDLVDRCVDPKTGAIVKSCTVDLRPRLTKRVTNIVEALGAIAGPGVPIVGMTYYDPFLGYWGLVPGGRELARATQRAWVVFNAGLRDAYWDGGAAVARVARTFRTRDFADTVVVPGRGRLPVNVARVCRWTWFCSSKFAGDPHPNRTGYTKVARTFERKLRHLLPPA